jgi:alpha-glucosidase
MFAYRHDILKALIADGVKLAVIGKNETISDLPEYKSKDIPAIDRLVRFLDYSPETKTLVVDEANVLGELQDPLSSGCQVIRVMAKAMYHATGLRPIDPNWETRPRGIWQQYELRLQRMDERFDQKLKDLHEKVLSAGKWKGTSAIHSRAEYWAQGVLAYFDAVGGGMTPVDADHPISTREILRDYDPGLFALVEEVMAYKGKLDWRYRR